MSDVSEAQAAEISDGEATVDEYQAAFRRYRECLNAAGFDLDGTLEFTDLEYQFVVPGAAVRDGADEECYESEFGRVDVLWQTTDQDKFARECLQEHGIEPADTVEEMDEQLVEAGVETPECL